MNRRGQGDTDEENPGKLFIGGLSYETTDESLREYFSKYGEVTECRVMMDSVTHRSRGFGFLTFKDPSSVQNVLAAPQHILNNKQIDPKQCSKRGSQENTKRSKSNKIFIGGLPSTVDREELRKFFSEHGNVTEAVIAIDPTTKNPRGFGFVTFDNEDDVTKLCKIHFVNLQGKSVEIKPAEPRTPGMQSGQKAQNGWAGSTNTYQQYGSQNQWPGYGGYGRYGPQYGANVPPSGTYGQYPQGQGGYPQPNDYYGYMGSAYGQQSSGYGPDRGSYGPPQTAGYEQGPPTSYPDYSSYGGYGSGVSGGYGRGSGYGDDSGYGQSGSSRGYHPYSR